MRIHWYRFRTPTGVALAGSSFVLIIMFALMPSSTGKERTGYVVVLSLLAFTISLLSIHGWKSWDKDR